MNNRNLIVVIFILILNISCISPNKPINKIDLIEEVVNECIVQDTLYITDTILNRLAHYNLYEYQFSDEGLEVPPKDLNYVNAEMLINHIGYEELFNIEKDESFIEGQLSNSKEFCSKNKLPKFNELSKEIRPKQFYIFYQPIFNKEYTAVYLRYNYINWTYGQGDAVLLKKNKNKWQLVKRFGIWIN